jgi:hypothetical protein
LNGAAENEEKNATAGNSPVPVIGERVVPELSDKSTTFSFNNQQQLVMGLAD